MLATFRVSELQMLLGFAGRNKSGRKTELQQRALDLLKVRSHPIHQKIRDLYKTIQQNGVLTGVQTPSTSPPNQDISAGAPVNSMPQQPGNMPRTAVHPYGVDSRQMAAARQPPMYQQNIYSPYPQYSQTKQQQQSVLTGNFPIHPDVTLRRLPFYDVLADLVKPSSLVPHSNQRMQEGNFYFSLTPQQATDIASSRDTRPGTCDYIKQVQMRFCLLETSCEQEDCFPPNVLVKVNNKLCPLPNPIPTNKPGVEPKRPPRPVNITGMVKLSPTVGNHISVSWATDFTRGYVISVSLVHKLSSMDLLQRLKSKGAKNVEYTRSIIKEKLSDDGDEIATTSLRVSLMCPLGKMRMTTPCRPMTCMHLQCFDASLFLQMNERKPTWNCPVCDKPALYDNLCIDGYFTEVLNSPLLPSSCNEIQLNKDGSWCVQTSEKPNAKVDKPTVIGLEDSVEIIDDLEIVSSNTAAAPTSTTDKTEDTAKPEESRKRDVVDLTFSSSDDEEPAAKVRAVAPKPDSTSISSSSNQSRVTTTPGPSSVSSSGYPASPSIINLDSPSPPRSPQPTPQPAAQQTASSCMMTGQTNGNTTPNQVTAPFMSPNSMPFLDLETETPAGANMTYPQTY
ncbi:E3 SUMO-protein ligase PIAS2-like isoform X2 [Diabrotica undecimpunctata]